jgi:hypothetical protein
MIQEAGQPIWMGESCLPEQMGLFHGTVDLVHFMANHLLGMPVIKMAIHNRIFCAWIGERSLRRAAPGRRNTRE